MSFLEMYPVITVLPLLIMLILVVITRRVFESIIVATALVFILQDAVGFITGFTYAMYDVFAEGTYPWILLVLTLFGALIALLIRSGGISAFRRLATRYMHSERSSLVFTWILGVILFIDDYINNLGIGPTVRDNTDKHKISREQVGFTVCSMGTPVCSLVPLTAIAVFIFGIMQEFGISGEDSDMLVEYMKLIPFLFYPIAIIVIAFLLSIGALPRVGVMRKYHKELHDGTYKLTDAEMKALEETDDGIEVAEDKGAMIDFALPVIALVGAMLISRDLILAVIVGLAVSFCLYIFRRKMSMSEFFQAFFTGVKDMIFILAVVLMTFVFVHGLEGIGFSDYVIEVVTPLLSGGAIPVLTFITVAIIAFLGVDYWAVMLLIAPISLPLADYFMVNPYMTMAAIVSGAVFGGTACFFAENILMCAQSVQRPPVRVALAGLPYSILGFIVSVVLYLIFGFAL